MNLLAHHKILLNDKIRMDAYRKAIRTAVKPGMIVADIGAGLGVLSHMALAAGASHVYAIEFDAETIALAEKESRITWIHGLSGDIRLPKKVDVIVSETLGSFALDENTLPTLIDARRRFLKKDGIVIPQALDLFVAPIATRSRNKVQTIKKEQLLAKPTSHRVDFLSETDPAFAVNTEFKIMRDGTLSGFAGWFDLQLLGKISFSTAPDASPTHWKQGVLPIRRPQKVKRGQTLHFQLEMKPDQLPTGVTTDIGYDYHVD
jgi:protein arginine N-methyltransferase 1